MYIVTLRIGDVSNVAMETLCMCHVSLVTMETTGAHE